MNKLVKASMISLAAVAVLSMTGCGSDDSSSSSSNGGAGKAVDGYIKGARVFLDVDGNGEFTTGEPYAYTDANGGYTLDVSEKDAAEAKANGGSIVVDDPKHKAIDMDSNKSFAGKLYAPFDGENADVKVTPLTSLAASVYGDLYEKVGVDANFSKVYNTVANLVLGDSNGTQLQQDPVALAQDKNNTLLLAKAMVLHHLAVSGNKQNGAADLASSLFNAENNGTITTKVTGVNGKSVANIFKAAGVLKDNVVISMFDGVENAIKKAGGADFNYSNVKAVAKILTKIDSAVKDNNTTLLRQLNSIISIAEQNVSALPTLADQVENNTSNLAAVVKKAMADQNITPKLSFGDVNITAGSADIADINSSDEFPAITVKNINDITKVSIALGKFLVDPIDPVDTNITLDFTKVDGANAVKEYNLTLPVTLSVDSAGNLHADIAKNRKLYGHSATKADDTDGVENLTYVITKDINFTTNDEAQLELNMKKIVDVLDNGTNSADIDADSDNNADGADADGSGDGADNADDHSDTTFKAVKANGFARIFDGSAKDGTTDATKDANYTMKVMFTGFNTSDINITTPTIKGQLNIDVQ